MMTNEVPAYRSIVTVVKWVCLRCGHEWRGKTEAEPTVCPKCHSPWWRVPRKQRKKQGGA